MLKHLRSRYLSPGTLIIMAMLLCVQRGARAEDPSAPRTLERGKVANLVVWSGDPLELSSRAETVLIRGRVVPLVSRQSQLFDKYRTLPKAP